MKRIALFILCFTLLLGTVSCGQDKPAGTKSGTEGATEGATETVTDNDSETESGKSSPEKSTSADSNELNHIATCDGIDFYRNEEGQIYAHIDAWGDTSFSLGYYDEIGDALLGEACAEIVAYTRGDSEVPYKDCLTVTVLKLDRNRKEIEARSNVFYVTSDEENTVIFFNYYQAGCAYYFYLPQSDPDLISNPYNPYDQRLHRYETTDGGKNWTDQTNDFLVHGWSWHQYPTVTKFVNKNVGIVGYRYLGDTAYEANICSRTYFTVDCGKTWELFPDLPYPFDYENGYSEVQDLEWIDNRYVLTIRYRYLEYEDTFTFSSEDMINWTLIEQQ